jgi:hypothetical protein
MTSPQRQPNSGRYAIRYRVFVRLCLNYTYGAFHASRECPALANVEDALVVEMTISDNPHTDGFSDLDWACKRCGHLLVPIQPTTAELKHDHAPALREIARELEQ